MNSMLRLWNELLLSDVTVTKTSVIFKLELQVNLDNAMRNCDSLLLMLRTSLCIQVLSSHELMKDRKIFSSWTV